MTSPVTSRGYVGVAFPTPTRLFVASTFSVLVLTVRLPLIIKELNASLVALESLSTVLTHFHTFVGDDVYTTLNVCTTIPAVNTSIVDTSPFVKEMGMFVPLIWRVFANVG